MNEPKPAERLEAAPKPAECLEWSTIDAPGSWEPGCLEVTVDTTAVAGTYHVMKIAALRALR